MKKSDTGARWITRETDANLPLMAETLGISETTARVMANRGIRSKKTALSFLKPSIDDLLAFAQMKDAEAALARIKMAIEGGEKITIFGDYDADGITSVTILHKVLARLGADVSYYIPHRVQEGYGMNKTAVQTLADTGTHLIIAVDNGISAVEEIALAAELGINTIIIDHHEVGEVLPPAVAIVDPKQSDCPYPFKELCAGGLSYKLAAALCEYMGVPFLERDEALVLAAIATICDIVPLVGENRILANCGMIVLNSNKLINPGLGSLLTIRGYLEKPIDTFTIGFVIGPCINAAGRLDDAGAAVELLLCDADDVSVRMQTAHKLTELNEQRKQLTADSADRILAKLADSTDKIYVITDEEIHESIAGIVAGRVREATGHPTIVLARGDDGDMKGSGRSSPCYNMFDALYANRDLFTRFGGHAMAAGLSLPEENVPLLREALNRDCTLIDDDFCTVVEIDAELALHDITIKLADELARLAPYGSGNKEPLFVARGLFANVRAIDEKNTLIFTFADSTAANAGRVKGIAFGLNEAYNATEAAARMDVVFGVEINVFNGNVSVQMRVRDFMFV